MNKKAQIIVPIPMYGGGGTLGLVGALISFIVFMIYSLCKNIEFMPFKYSLSLLLILCGIGTYIDYKMYNDNNSIPWLIIGLDIFVLICFIFIYYSVVWF